jgi:hypothetical protein
MAPLNSGAGRMLSAQFQHVADRVHHHAHGAASDVQDDDDREAVVLHVVQVEAHAHVDDGHDHAAQVDHALDEVRRVGNARGGS